MAVAGVTIRRKSHAGCVRDHCKVGPSRCVGTSYWLWLLHSDGAKSPEISGQLECNLTNVLQLCRGRDEPQLLCRPDVVCWMDSSIADVVNSALSDSNEEVAPLAR